MMFEVLLLTSVLALAPTSESQDWRTPAEISDYTRTPRYAETMDWFKRLEQGSEVLEISSFGVSPEGRELPLLIVSSHGAFTPEAARELGKEIILIQAAIHPGENEGKDALMAVLRDLTVGDADRSLLDEVTLLVMPIFNVDGHERFSPYNRINQNGPEAMGWRATAQNLNLNRDFAKADSPEMQAWLRVWNAWQPDLLIDMHNTNGADYQYPVTWAWEHGPNIHPELGRWQNAAFGERVQGELSEKDWKVHRYVSLIDRSDLSKGLLDWVSTPRFSCGYAAAVQRACLLVETHMLKDFRTRTRVNEDLLMAILAEFQRNPGTLRAAVERAESDVRSRLPGSRYAVAFSTAEESREIEFLSYEYSHTDSDISGGAWLRYDQSKPKSFVLPMRDRIEIAADVEVPVAYLIPAAWTAVIERLTHHGVRMERLDEPRTVSADTYRFSEVKFAPRPFEARHMVSDFQSENIAVEIDLPPGSVRIPLDQERADIVIHLLEPAGPDSLLRWGFFNAIFEEKEYAEPRVMEAMAREMLAADDSLREEFQLRLKDPGFAADPRARLRWFYQRTPYFDQALNRYPVLRERVAEDTSGASSN